MVVLLSKNYQMARTKSKQLKPKIVRQINLYKEALKEAKIPVTKLILFGSQAKGTARRWSDIDLAIVSKAFGKDRHDERLKLMRLRSDNILDIEPHPFHPNDLKERWSTIAYEIKTHGQTIPF